MQPFDLTGYRVEVRYEKLVLIGDVRSLGYFKTMEEAAAGPQTLKPREVLVLTQDGKTFYPLGEQEQTSVL